MKSIVIFGSITFRPMSAKDLDMLIVIDKLSDPLEKTGLEMKLIETLKNVSPYTPIDVTVFDESSFRENLEPGALASGLVAGYEILYDELGIEGLLHSVIEKIASEDYIIYKRGKKINLSAFAKAKLRTLRKRKRRE